MKKPDKSYKYFSKILAEAIKMICEHLTSDDGTVVLVYKYTPSEREFYKGAAHAFRGTVRGRLFSGALADFAASTDRRKRYRFPPWLAEFHAADDGAATELTIAVNGEVLRHERHIFDGELLMKRERM